MNARNSPVECATAAFLARAMLASGSTQYVTRSAEREANVRAVYSADCATSLSAITMSNENRPSVRCDSSVHRRLCNNSVRLNVQMHTETSGTDIRDVDLQVAAA